MSYGEGCGQYALVITCQCYLTTLQAGATEGEQRQAHRRCSAQFWGALPLHCSVQQLVLQGKGL